MCVGCPGWWGWRGEQWGCPEKPGPITHMAPVLRQCHDGGEEGGGTWGHGAAHSSFAFLLRSCIRSRWLLRFGPQHGLLGFGFSPSCCLLSKSRQSWGREAGGEPRFSHLLPASQPAGAQHSCPPKSGLLQGLPQIHPAKAGLPQSFPTPPGGGHCKYCWQRQSPALVSARHVPLLRLQLDRVAFENSVKANAMPLSCMVSFYF